MEYKNYYICDEEGNSNCIIRTFSKLFNKEYNTVKSELTKVAKSLQYNDYKEIEVFEKYLNNNNYYEFEVDKDTPIKELDLSKGKYAIFCYDKNEYYHMFPVIDNTYYDKSKDSIDLYILKIYKETII